MKNCIRCRAQIEDDAKFCSECGSAQPTVQPQSDGGTAGENIQTEKENPNPGQNSANGAAAALNSNAPGSGQALASLICGIASVVLSVPVSALGLIFGVVAIVLGVLAKKKLPQGQAGFAVAGFVTGIIGAVISLIIIIFVLVIFAAISSHVPPFLTALRHL